MAEFSSEILKKFVAPSVDEQPIFDLPDLRFEFDQHGHWPGNLFLNSVFVSRYVEEFYPHAVILVSRSKFVFDSYRMARLRLIKYRDNWKFGNPGLYRYCDAVSSWEVVILNLQIIYDTLKVSVFNSVNFDLSDSQKKIHYIGNRIKHAADDVRRRGLRGPPLWLGREGFTSIKATVSYDEMVNQIRFVGRLADCLSDVPNFPEKFEKLLSLNAAHQGVGEEG